MTNPIKLCLSSLRPTRRPKQTSRRPTTLLSLCRPARPADQSAPSLPAGQSAPSTLPVRSGQSALPVRSGQSVSQSIPPVSPPRPFPPVSPLCGQSVHSARPAGQSALPVRSGQSVHSAGRLTGGEEGHQLAEGGLVQQVLVRVLPPARRPAVGVAVLLRVTAAQVTGQTAGSAASRDVIHRGHGTDAYRPVRSATNTSIHPTSNFSLDRSWK